MQERAIDGHEAAAMHGGGWEVLEFVGTSLGVLLLLGLLAVAAWGAYRLYGNLGLGGGRMDSAEAVLRERFARGEISAGEFEETLETLRRNAPQAGGTSLMSSIEGPRRRYEQYVREAMSRLRLGRTMDS